MRPRLSVTHPAFVGRHGALPRAIHAVVLAGGSGVAVAGEVPTPPDAEAYEFDSRFFPAGSRAAADISRFAHANVVLPDVYPVDIIFNGQRQNGRDVRFAVLGDAITASPCIEPDWLIEYGVDATALASAKATPGACQTIDQLVPGATATFDVSDQRLELTVPQAHISHLPRGYVPPQLWDQGINAGLLSYRANTYQTSTSQGSSVTTSYLGLDAGLNLGAWHLRHTGTLHSTSGRGARYQQNATYVHRDLPGMGAQLYVGETYTDGTMFDSLRLTGVRLVSDSQMLPGSRAGYAPVIRGVAAGTARVTITQRGILLYETTVPPGAFAIDDLYPTGYGGDLKVTVTEADGRRSEFDVPYAATPQLLREGRTDYALNVGHLNEVEQAERPWLAQATIRHGISNNLTGYMGGLMSRGYAAYQFGTAFNARVGAISADITYAHANVPGLGLSNGHSIQLRYSKTFVDTGTIFALGAYRYSTASYLGLLDANRLRSLYRQGQDISQYERIRSRFDITLNQSLGGRRGSLFLSGSAETYWNSGRNSVTYSAGYSSMIGSATVGLGVQRVRTASADAGRRRSESRAQFTVSLPLGSAPRRPYFTSEIAHESASGLQGRAGLSGGFGDQGQFGYAGSMSRRGGRTAVEAMASYAAPVADLSVAGSDDGQTRTFSAGAAGGLIVHGGGVTFSQTLGETVALAHAPDAAGAQLSGTRGARLDRRGYGVVPYLSPYQMNEVAVDPVGTSLDVEIKATSQRVAPHRGAVVLVKYQTVSGRALLVKARSDDGQVLPFGAEVFDRTGQVVGVVGQAGRIFVRDSAGNDGLTVRWGKGDHQSCNIVLPDNLPATSGKTLTTISGSCARPVPVAAHARQATSLHYPGGTPDARP
ncbi:outer membrane usher protein [Luteibacter sp. Sphag1AF]|uniref:fimbria/pilus outer membrane usher protein n=1 Tax=Luteibacter sp. Sphag1AF TaxID=2587031 RepID=UPI001614BD39|nr:fimbria/pilus outer membrane usher protein [Luteibacter sp. Sphag1AF]MBB3227643.1 outer membrane usher protein [Luteibacter sp. Sphag1AF]